MRHPFRSAASAKLAGSTSGDDRKHSEALDVEGRAREDEEPFDVGQPAELNLTEARDGFDPAEDAFDPGATGLTLGVAVATACTTSTWPRYASRASAPSDFR